MSLDVPALLRNVNVPDFSECSICLDEINSGWTHELDKITHIFHEHCLRDSMQKDSLCPNCRISITWEKQATVFPALTAAITQAPPPPSEEPVYSEPVVEIQAPLANVNESPFYEGFLARSIWDEIKDIQIDWSRVIPPRQLSNTSRASELIAFELGTKLYAIRLINGNQSIGYLAIDRHPDIKSFRVMGAYINPTIFSDRLTL